MAQLSIELEGGALQDTKKRINEIQSQKPAQPKISPFNKMVAQNIAAARRISGLSQSDVGQALYGRDAKNRICEYETGAQRPSVETIYRLAKVLGCSADYLLGLSAEYEANLDTSRYGAMYSMLQDTSKHINQTIATMMMVQLRKVPSSLTCTLMAQADDVDYYLGNIRQHTPFDKKIPGAANLITAVDNLSKTAGKMRKQLQEQMRSLERAVQDSHLNDDAVQGHLMAWDVVEPIPAPKVRKA